MSAPPSLAQVDAVLAAWRDRLAAASRNVAELSELPEFMALKAAGRSGPVAAGAGRVVATVDELWQSVLLLGEALGRAEAARAAAARLWMPASLDAVMQVLDGPSISVALGSSPVLHRRLLGRASDVAKVSPADLLATMEGAFDNARALLARISTAAEAGAALRARLQSAVDGLARESRPEAADLAVRLASCPASDPMAALDELEALRPAVDAASAAAAASRAGRAQAVQALAAARTRLAHLAELQAKAAQALAQAAPLVSGSPPPGPATDAAEMPGWLDRLARTLDAGRVEAFGLGLASWNALAARVAAGWQAALDDAAARLAQRDDLRGRFGALQAKHRARHPGADPALDGIAADLRAALFGGPADLAAGRRLLAAYEAGLARPPVSVR